MLRSLLAASLAFVLLSPQPARAQVDWSVVASDVADGQLEILWRANRVATYRYRDSAITRPYFCNLVAPDGTPVTRNHPPQPDDRQDHADLHPGLWLAFGDLDGSDNWRLRARVEHDRFVDPPRPEGDRLSFAVENSYWNHDGSRKICREVARYNFQPVPHGILLRWDSAFRSDDHDFYFGDQEEMGLGVRLATPLAVASGHGGRILDAAGRTNEHHVWGTSSAWCDYAGSVNGRFVGVLLMPHPENFRPCWYHARDYGFIAANPFGRHAFNKGEKSKVVVRRGEVLRLRFGIVIHSSTRDDAFDPRDAYMRYQTAVAQEP